MKINDTFDGATLSLATPRTNSFQTFGEALNDIHATLSKNKEIAKRDKKEADAEFDNKSFIDFANSGQDINTYLTKENPLAFKNASTIINAVDFDNNRRKSNEDIRSKKLVNDNATDKYEDDKLLSIYYTDPKEFAKKDYSFTLGSTIREIYDDTIKWGKLELEKENSKFDKAYKIDNSKIKWGKLALEKENSKFDKAYKIDNSKIKWGKLGLEKENAKFDQSWKSSNLGLGWANFGHKVEEDKKKPPQSTTNKPKTMKQIQEDKKYTSEYLSQVNPHFNSLDDEGKNFATDYYIRTGKQVDIKNDGGAFGSGMFSKTYIDELENFKKLKGK
jgi:hypothetical protein